MLDKCILHIGMNKAGSSAIQNYLYQQDLGESFYYTDLGTPNHSAFILSLFSETPETIHSNVKMGLTKEEIAKNNERLKERLLRQFSLKKAETYILSGEGMLHLNEQELRGFKAYLQEYFSHIRVVAYVREPVSYMESLYQQCLKGGLTNEFKVRGMYPYYKNKFEKFYTVFGEENVRLLEYNKVTFKDGDLLSDFCHNIGLEYSPLPDREANTSLSTEATALLYVNRKFFPYGVGENVIEDNERMIEALRQYGRDKFEIDYSMLEPILRQNKKDVEWVEQKLGVKLTIKSEYSENAIKSEDDLLLLASALFQESNDLKGLESIAARVDSLKKEGQTKALSHLQPVEDVKKPPVRQNKKELCILHIGMPKTGSTSIQKELYHHIADGRANYVNLENPNHGVALVSMFKNNPLEHHFFKKRAWTEEQIEQFNEKNRKLLLKSFKDNTTSIEILSGEDMYHFPKPSLKRLKKFLDKYFKKILVIAYVRPPKSFMESAFQQLVKFNNLGSFDFSVIYHPYKKFERFDEIFGQENVKLVKFAPKEFPEEDVLLDFYQQIGLSGTKSRLKKLNETLSQEVISILFAYHYFGTKIHFGSKEVPVEHKLVSLLRSIGDTKFRFSPSLIEKVLEEYADDIHWIEDRMGIELVDNKGDTGIDSEADLLWFALRSIPNLKKLLGDSPIEENELRGTPADIVVYVDALKHKLATEMEFTNK